MRVRRAAWAALWVGLASVGCASGGSGGGGEGEVPALVALNAAGTFDVDFAGYDGARLRDVDPRVRVDGRWFAASDYPAPAERRTGNRFEWRFEGPGLPAWVYRVRVAAGGRWADVDMEILAPAGVVDGFEPLATSDAWVRGLGEEVYFLRNGYNIFSFSGMVRVTAADRAPRAPDGTTVPLTGNNFDVFNERLAQGWWWGSIGAPGGRATIVAGALTTDLWKTAVLGEPSTSARAELRVIQGTTGDRWDLARGPVASERVFVAAGDDYAEVWRRYGEALRASKPGLRWEGEAPRLWSSWHQSFDRVTAADVLRNADALAADPAYDPIRYVQLDDGWQEAWGDWTANEKFPEGMAALADAVRARGRTPGIWVAPTLVDSDSRLAADHPDWLLRDAAGTPVECITCSLGAIGRQVFTLDVTRPEVRDFIRSTLADLDAMGYRFFKLDFTLFAAHEGAYFDPDATAMTAYADLLRAIREGVGPDTFLNVVGAPVLPVVGGAHATRSGTDIHYSFNENDPSHVSFVDNARNLMARFVLTPGSILYDLDALIARDPLTDDEVRAMATVEAMAAGMYSIGEELAALSPARKAILTHPALFEISRSGGQAVPLDPYDEAGEDILISSIVEHILYRLGVPTRSRQPNRWWLAAGRGVHYVALFNWRDVERTLTLRRAELGVASVSRMTDLWRAAEAAFDPGGTFRARIPAHAVVLLRIEE